jgi:hypothetical protein
MASPVQPTLYKPEYRELAHNYCLRGATNEVLANFFGVASRTVAAAVRKGLVARAGNFRTRQRHAKIRFVAQRADRAGTLRREQRKLRKLRKAPGSYLV